MIFFLPSPPNLIPGYASDFGVGWDGAQGRLQDFTQGGQDFEEHKIMKIGTKNSMRKSCICTHAAR